MKLKILHVAPDYKFIPFVAEVFNTFEDTSNLFLIDIGAKLARVAEQSENLRFVDIGYFGSDEMARDLTSCDCLVVHFLYAGSAKMILEAPSHVTVVWSGWGGDYYDLLLPTVARNLLESNPNGLVAGIHNRTRAPSGLIKRAGTRLRHFKRDFLLRRKLIKAVRRANFFSAPIRDDYELIQAAQGARFPAQYIQLNYGSVERTFSPGSAKLTGNNILVGNSATPTNNHAAIFHMLTKLDLADRRIVVPLSYGDSEYKDAVIAHGDELFGARFQPIVNFLPLEKYNAVIAECSIVVMGHFRQQALGNICTMLYKGAKVFLNEDSVVYRFFRNRGAFIYGLRDLLTNDRDVFAPVTDEQAQRNREILATLWAHDVALNNARHLIDLVQARKVNAHRTNYPRNV